MRYGFIAASRVGGVGRFVAGGSIDPIGCAGRRATFAVHAVEQSDHAANRIARQRIMNRLGLAPGRDQFRFAQPGELLRERRLADADQAFEFADRFLAPGEVAQDQQPVLVGDRLEKSGRGRGVVDDSDDW